MTGSDNKKWLLAGALGVSAAVLAHLWLSQRKKNAIPRAQDDFYNHVNKKWLEDKNNQIPDEYSRWGGFIKLHDDGLKNQIKLVNNLKNKASLTEEEMKISAIWEASCSRFTDWEQGKGDMEPILLELKELDAILCDDKEAWTDRVAKYLHYSQMNGIGNVVNFDKGSDFKNSNNVVLDVSCGGTSLPSRDYYFDEKFQAKFGEFKKHLQRVYEMVNTGKKSLDDDFVENVLAFEVKLAEMDMKREHKRRYDEYYTNSSLKGLYEDINTLKALEEKQEANYKEEDRNLQLNKEQQILTKNFCEKVYELFNFRAVMTENLESNFKGDANGPAVDHLTVFDGDHFRRAFSLVLNPASLKEYRCYLQYKVIKSFKAYTTKEMDEEFFDFYSRKLSGQAEQQPCDKRSIQIVNAFAGEMMGKVFVSKYFPSAAKSNLIMMIDEVLNVMRVSINNNDWLTSETKAAAIIKLDKFRVKVGFPDVWKDYSTLDIKTGDSLYQISKKSKQWAVKVEFYKKINSVLDRTEWLMTPQTVNAYFMPTQNEIVFPAAILQPPFYTMESKSIDFDMSGELKMLANVSNLEELLVSAVNFGGIGAVIAHEITHGYDDKGRKFDGEGNLQDWWTEEDAALFTKKTDFMADQVKEYVWIDKEDGNKKYFMNAQLTMGENLADLGGVSLSLKGFLKRIGALGLKKEEEKALIRIFFKSWANVWKQTSKKESRIQMLTTDPHAPTDFRGNIVKNIDEFYTAFEVKKGDKMYLDPAKRVFMW